MTWYYSKTNFSRYSLKIPKSATNCSSLTLTKRLSTSSQFGGVVKTDSSLVRFLLWRHRSVIIWRYDVWFESVKIVEIKWDSFSSSGNKSCYKMMSNFGDFGSNFGDFGSNLGTLEVFCWREVLKNMEAELWLVRGNFLTFISNSRRSNFHLQSLSGQ